MKKNTGIWIDHREAFLVTTEGETTSMEHVASGADSNLKPSGGWKAGGTSVAQSIVKEKSAEESRMHQYHAFFQQIIALLGDSDSIALFGPGEAKGELAKEIRSNHDLQNKITAVETCERMTENQLIAKVKAYFGAGK